MDKKIDELKSELDKLKSTLHFWKTITLLSVIDIPLMVAVVLSFLGIAELNASDGGKVRFLLIRSSSLLFVISSIVIMIISNLYLVFKDDWLNP